MLYWKMQKNKYLWEENIAMEQILDIEYVFHMQIVLLVPYIFTFPLIPGRQSMLMTSWKKNLFAHFSLTLLMSKN